MTRKHCRWIARSGALGLGAWVVWAWLVAVTAAADELVSVSAEPGLAERPLTSTDRQHWSFRPVTRPTPPRVDRPEWTRCGVDCFIAERLQQADIQPLPPASRQAWLRRVTFDLTGLPPTPDQVDRFLSDASPAAFERVIDRLLASPTFGERWAQHWLDLARFAETDGYEHDHVRQHAWRFRDWVIDALNRDLPYDEFVRQQIAGDELYGDQRAPAVATGFLLSGPDMPDINLQQERRHKLLNEMTATVGSVFMGVTLECAQCHDHKFDPISQADFYRFRAIFENAVGTVERDKQVGMVVHEPGSEVTVARMMIRGDFRRPGPPVEPAFIRVINLQGQDVPLLTDGASHDRPRSALADWITRAEHPLTARVAVNRLWQHHFGKGLVETPSDFGNTGLPPQHPKLLDWLATELARDGWSLKRLHRLLVTSATYRLASSPRDRHWPRQRTQQAQAHWATGQHGDPENRLWWRMNRKRLEGEAIRDAMLAAAGQLSCRRGGPGIKPPLPPAVMATLLDDQWQVSPHPESHHRRSIYLFARRNLVLPIFEAFDRPDGNTSCSRRSRSTTAPQSLLLLNSDFSLTMAEHLAHLALNQAPRDHAAQVVCCYRRALGRPPSTSEMEIATSFLVSQAARIASEARRAEDDARRPGVATSEAALADFCLALLNINEFVYID